MIKGDRSNLLPGSMALRGSLFKTCAILLVFTAIIFSQKLEAFILPPEIQEVVTGLIENQHKEALFNRPESSDLIHSLTDDLDLDTRGDLVNLINKSVRKSEDKVEHVGIILEVLNQPLVRLYKDHLMHQSASRLSLYGVSLPPLGDSIFKQMQKFEGATGPDHQDWNKVFGAPSSGTVNLWRSVVEFVLKSTKHTTRLRDFAISEETKTIGNIENVGALDVHQTKLASDAILDNLRSQPAQGSRDVRGAKEVVRMMLSSYEQLLSENRKIGDELSQSYISGCFHQLNVRRLAENNKETLLMETKNMLFFQKFIDIYFKDVDLIQHKKFLECNQVAAPSDSIHPISIEVVGRMREFPQELRMAITSHLPLWTSPAYESVEEKTLRQHRLESYLDFRRVPEMLWSNENTYYSQHQKIETAVRQALIEVQQYPWSTTTMNIHHKMDQFREAMARYKPSQVKESDAIVTQRAMTSILRDFAKESYVFLQTKMKHLEAQVREPLLYHKKHVLPSIRNENFDLWKGHSASVWEEEVRGMFFLLVHWKRVIGRA